jgi:hypothetical protein
MTQTFLRTQTKFIHLLAANYHSAITPNKKNTHQN